MNDLPPKRPWYKPSWIWAPFIGIGCVAIVNVIMVNLAHGVGTDKVVDDPYTESQGFDAEHTAIGNFKKAGLVLAINTQSGQPALQLSGTSTDLQAEVTLYRASDRAADTVLTWPSTTSELPLPPSSTGLWYITFQSELDGKPIRKRLKWIN